MRDVAGAAKLWTSSVEIELVCDGRYIGSVGQQSQCQPLEGSY